MIANETIKVTKNTKERLDFLKIIPQDTYNNVIIRLLDDNDKKTNGD